MKRIILIIALVLPLISFSQVNKSIVDTTKTWYNGFAEMGFTSTNVVNIKGDTSIQDLGYKKVYFSQYKGDSNDLDNSKFAFFVREFSNRVYVREYQSPNTISEDIIVYDFNLGKGDTINIPFIMGRSIFGSSLKITIDSVDSIEINGTNLKRMFLSSDASGFIPCQWIEGIGSTSGIFQALGEIFDGPGLVLNCLYQGDSLIYHGGPFSDCLVYVGLEDINNDISVKLYPTIINDILNISSTDYPLNISIIDLLGKELLKETLYYDKAINTSYLKSGFYNCKLNTKDNKTLFKKIIKQ